MTLGVGRSPAVVAVLQLLPRSRWGWYFLRMKKLIAIVGLLLAGCGAPGLGEECDTSNSTEDCDEGLVCTKEATATVCRILCDDASVVCPQGTTCSGISGGSHKSCQP